MKKKDLEKVVDYVMFDFKWKDQNFKVVLDHTINNAYMREYFCPLYAEELYGEDPAWCGFEMPDGQYLDFQVHDYDGDGVLDVDVCELDPIGECYSHGRFLLKEEYEVKNIIAIFKGGHS